MTVRPRPRARLLVPLLAAAVSLLAAAPAGAVTAYLDGDTLYIEGTVGGENFSVDNG